MKIIRKCVGKSFEVVETDEKYFTNCAKKFLGDDITIERVYLEGFEFILAVDEDGLAKQLPHNFFMAFENNPHFPVQTIVGDVLFIRNKPCNPYLKEICDFEVLDVTEKDIIRIQDILNPMEQIVLGLTFKELYGR